jgi:hypothetical protein
VGKPDEETSGEERLTKSKSSFFENLSLRRAAESVSFGLLSIFIPICQGTDSHEGWQKGKGIPLFPNLCCLATNDAGIDLAGVVALTRRNRVL